MRFIDGSREILKVQKIRRIVSHTGFYCFTAVDPAGMELLTNDVKLIFIVVVVICALGNCFEIEEWGPIEWCVMSDHFARQGKSPFEHHVHQIFMSELSLRGYIKNIS
ncbi:hypothetical protein DCAR_0934371 [Daucus carota subsp. sativus]|uniref:Uncharacterized protein n=1 Tax=Daucus carota subsp. sativus TaxID=79200 RepID=A0AAF0XVN0_DAUCS|nr:hypothetical protein DCAR_0934371 [Daucus carota subsp. sativus]